MIGSISQEYPQENLDSIVYLDTAGKSVQPKSVEQIGYECIKSKSIPWRGLKGTEGDVHDLRDLYAKLINAPSKEHIAITPSTGFAMTMVAENVVNSNLLKKGQKVILLEKEMASVVYPWQTVCKKVGAKICQIPFPEWDLIDSSWANSIINAIDNTTAILALPCVHWCDGSKIDVSLIVKYLNKIPEESRPLLIIDGTQSIGASPLDISELKPAFMACSIHKWLLGPYGMSLVYVDEKYHSSWFPLDYHERSRVGSDQTFWDEEVPFDKELGFPEPFFSGARRFDSGGRPSYILIPMAIQSLSLIKTWSVLAISTYLAELTNSLEIMLQDLSEYIKFIPSQNRSHHIFGIKLTTKSLNLGLSLKEIESIFKSNSVFFSIRGQTIRIAPYIFTTQQHLNIFVTLLKQYIKMKISIDSLIGFPLKKILITGSNGWLAQFVFNRLTQLNHLPILNYGTYSSNSPNWILPQYRIHLDLASIESINYVIETIKPDIVLHFAAISSPLKCHSDPIKAKLINCPIALIESIKRNVPNCWFIYSSTDMVYDGENPIYDVNHECKPINQYGLTKLLFEKEVMTLKNGYVLRLSNMIGQSCVFKNNGDKFIKFLFESFQKRQYIGLKNEEFRSFVYVEDVVNVVITLITNAINNPLFFLDRRILNVGGPNGLSRLQLGLMLAEACSITLYVDNGKQLPPEIYDESEFWRVFSMENDLIPRESLFLMEKLNSPKDITMNSSDTEKFLSVHFTPITKSIIQLCLKY